MKCPECGNVLRCLYKNYVKGARYGGVPCWRRSWRCVECGYIVKTRELTDDVFLRMQAAFEERRQQYIRDIAKLQEEVRGLHDEPTSAEYKLYTLRKALRDVLKRFG